MVKLSIGGGCDRAYQKVSLDVMLGKTWRDGLGHAGRSLNRCHRSTQAKFALESEVRR